MRAAGYSSSSTGTYFLISPQIGPVHGNQTTVTPTQNTTYTLYATNPFGRTTAAVTVSVH